jgi:uncharacterized membrane protein YdbT with pleckstrin-like domain
MILETSQIRDFLKDLSLFTLLDDAQIEKIAYLFHVVERKPDDLVVAQGSRADGFYVIMDGQVAVHRQLSRADSQIVMYVPGDFFGEDSLLRNKVEPATITALTPLILLKLDIDQFYALIDEFPIIEDRLTRFIKSHEYLETLHFDWLNDDEVVYQVRRRHVAYLAIMLLIPSALTFIGVSVAGFAFLNWSSSLVRDISLFVAAIGLGIGLGWTIWNWIDWGNDYYVVTNQRVVWIEEVIWLYDSRIEAPLNTILSVNVRTTFIGRLLGYGDVIVTTFTGKVVLETVSNPYQLSSLISEYQQRTQRDTQQADVKEMRRSVKRILGEKEVESSQEPEMSRAKSIRNHREPDQLREPSSWEKYFGNIFKTRLEQDHTITYRKHWLVLIRKTLLPTIFSLTLFSLVATFDIIYFLNQVQFISPLLVTSLGALVFILILLPWWLYHYVDWRNDIYQVTDRSIFDIERKPFGTESRKSAPLENILSLEHERPGFIGYILNVGLVTINVGETKFTFDNVFQPARVQQDVFNRMHALRIQKQREEVARERNRILRLIEIYHEEVGKDHRLQE